MSEPTLPHRPWALWLLTALMAVGTVIGVYMARHHEVELYGGEAYATEVLVGCAEAEGVSCDIVNTSEWSEILGVPTFAWAVPTYVLVGIMALLAARGRHGFKPLIAAVGLACVGLSIKLYDVSVNELQHVCLWCMRLYAINVAIPVLALISGTSRRHLPGRAELLIAAAVFGLGTGVTVGVQKAYRAMLLGDAPAVERLAAVSDPEPGAIFEDPSGDPPALAFDVTTEDGNPGRIEVRPGDAWKGNPEAKVAIIEFADFECGYCKRAGAQLRRLYEAYADEIVFVYKHFPMDPACNPGVRNKRHRDACDAHLASVCAQEQGRFWAYHDLLYKNQHDLRSEALLAYAEAVGVDMPTFQACLRSEEARAKVVASAEEGKAVDTHGTPRIWIADRLYRSGSSAEQMARALEQALGHDAATTVARASALREDRPLVRAIPDDVPEMRRITTGDLDFWIDTFEASIEDGEARVGKHRIPAVRASWFAARDACEATGKRMCSEQEWLAACQGAMPVDDDGDGEFADDMIEGTAYPYGDFHTPGLCWEDRTSAGPPVANADGTTTSEPWRPVYTGEMPGCVTPTGVYDLTGNVEEWVGETAERATLLGGAFDTPNDKARCYRRNDTFGAGYANLRTGFRCCKDAR